MPVPWTPRARVVVARTRHNWSLEHPETAPQWNLLLEDRRQALDEECDRVGIIVDRLISAPGPAPALRQQRQNVRSCGGGLGGTPVEQRRERQERDLVHRHAGAGDRRG